MPLTSNWVITSTIKRATWLGGTASPKLMVSWSVASIDAAEVQWGDHLHDKTRQMAGRQGVAQTHGFREHSVIIWGFEFSGHTKSLPVSQAALRQTARKPNPRRMAANICLFLLRAE